MLPIVNQALMMGFTASQLLKFISAKIPNMKKGIDSAKASGFDENKILKFLSQKIPYNKSGVERQLNANDQYMSSQGFKTKEEREESRNKALKGALGVGSAALSAYALSRSIPSNVSSLVSAVSGAPGQNLSSSPQQELQQEEKIQLPAQQLQQQVPQQPPLDLGNANIPQAANIEQSKENNDKLTKLFIGFEKGRDKGFDFESDAFLKIAKRMKSTGSIRSKEDFEKFFNLFEQKKAEGKELPTALKEASIEYDSQKLSPTDQHAIDEPKEVEAPKIEKNSLVSSPNGTGEVIHSRNGKALIQTEDGKKHQVEESKLLKPPREAAIEAMELIKSFTPEQMRSTHHMLNSYDEEEKKAFFVFHDGSAYVVDDISPEEYEELSKEVEEAKTSGETIIGKWAKGYGSRGAGYNKVVKGHRDRKVVPELVKKFRKLKVGYNLLSEWQRLLNEK